MPSRELPTKFTSTGYHRVAITGAGIITAMGNGWRENADGFRDGRLALRRISVFDASRQRVDRAGEVEMPERLPPNRLGPRQLARLERGSLLLLHAALEAWQQAGLPEARGTSIPICLGTSAGAMETGELYYKQAVQHPGRHAGQPTRVQQYQIQSQALLLADALGISGQLTVVSNACASGANSIGHAFEHLRHGRAHTAVAGGYDALCEMVFAGFDSLQALTTGLPRPFDAQRDGLALGEGAGIFILETFEHAMARGAEILGELCGYGAATDLHHLTQPHPAGEAAVLSMTRACEIAGIRPEQIGYINSHGTGTPLNDVAEANAIVRWAGENTAAGIAVSSTKASIGHLLGGAGSVEAVICLMALREGWLPPTTTIRTPDPACRFDLVRAPRNQDVDFVLTNSFGFGGANATLILGKVAASAGNVRLAAAPVEDTAICIAGVGAVSPAGWGADALVEAVLAGKAPSTATSIRAAGALPVTVRVIPPPPAPLPFLREPRLRRVSPISRFAVAAALEALGEHRQARVRAGDLRLGIIFAISNGCVIYSRRFYAEVLANSETASPILFPETVFNAPSSHLGALLGTPEINYTVVGDASGFASALRLASDWLREGRVGGVLLVSAEEADWISGEAAALYDKNLVVTEGAAAIYLELGGSGIRIEHHPQELLFCRNQGKQAAAAAIAETLLPEMSGNCVLCDGLSGAVRTDAVEEASWKQWTGSRFSVRRILGEGLGTSVGWQTVLAVELLRRGLHDRACVSAIGSNQQAGGFVLAVPAAQQEA